MVKPVWASYLRFVEEAGADAAFQAEGGIFNGGNYVMLPTPASIAFARRWAAMAPRMLRERNHDQDGLAYMARSAWAACEARGECHAARANVSLATAGLRCWGAWRRGRCRCRPGSAAAAARHARRSPAAVPGAGPSSSAPSCPASLLTWTSSAAWLPGWRCP